MGRNWGRDLLRVRSGGVLGVCFWGASEGSGELGGPHGTLRVPVGAACLSRPPGASGWGELAQQGGARCCPGEHGNVTPPYCTASQLLDVAPLM